MAAKPGKFYARPLLAYVVLTLLLFGTGARNRWGAASHLAGPAKKREWRGRSNSG